MIIPLIRHKNSGFTEIRVVDVYLSPACGGGKITSTQFFLIDKGILQWCTKGIVIIYKEKKYVQTDKTRGKCKTR